MPQSADDRAANPDRDFVTIVTGLPRSGTSMMMQMLIAGGLPALTDQQRQPDEDNPRGYFELDDAKRLGQGHVAWLPSAAGRCVKIVVPLIAHVPQGNYRVIVMERDLDEILQSQHAMLARSGKRGARLPPEQLKAILAKHLREADALLTQWGCPTVRVAYRTCVERPAAAAAEVNALVGGMLDEPPMAAAVDANLYRQNASPSGG